MTKIEENDKFIKEQKARIKNEIASLTRIVVDACLNDYKKYDIVMDCGTSGNNISFRIYDKNGNQSHCLDHYSMNLALGTHSLIFDKKEILKDVNKIISKIQEMKILAKKYSKLNQNNKT